MTLAPFVQIIARGQGRARAMTCDEARDAMTLILSGQAEPEAVGALLMVLRLRGETADEIAGFTAALRAHPSALVPRADLDWPVYAAGRTRGAPLFVLAARLVARAGYTVHMHGWNGETEAAALLRKIMTFCGSGIVYTPLESLNKDAYRILRLRDTFGLRSCFNTVLRMWNPSKAPVSLQGVFHPSYRGLQAMAAEQLGDDTLTIIKGGGGEFERHPAKDIAVFGLRNGQHIRKTVPALVGETRRLSDASASVDAEALWRGDQNDSFAECTVTGTAALALWSLKAAATFESAQELADALWSERRSSERLRA